MKKTILIVDDSAVDRAMLRMTLQNEYEVAEAENGSRAMELLSASPSGFDLIVSDYYMPEMDGIEFLRILKGKAQFDEIPVLIATSAEDPVAERECLDMGCWDFLRKPYDPIILSMRVRNNLERKELQTIKRRQIVRTFEQHLDPAVVDILLNGSGGASSAGQKENVAVLFADIRNFTALSEQLTPETVVRILNECLTVTGESIRKYGGVLDKFIGDCTMAYWIAGENSSDHVLSACKAAVNMRSRTDKLLRTYGKEYGVDVSLGVGINCGPAIVGNVGSAERMDYTVIGDTVNTASRLEMAAPLGEIYISREAAEAVNGRAVVTEVKKAMALKGKRKTVDVFSLKGINE